MKISDVIADMILDMFDDNKSTVQIQRNDLAARVGCVPSQINYVITPGLHRSRATALSPGVAAAGVFSLPVPTARTRR